MSALMNRISVTTWAPRHSGQNFPILFHIVYSSSTQRPTPTAVNRIGTTFSDRAAPSGRPTAIYQLKMAAKNANPHIAVGTPHILPHWLERTSSQLAYF